MSESRHSEIRLSLTEGTADKEYQAWLEQVDGHFHVDFAYGRRGSALKTGRKTASPLPLEEAAAALARLVRSKEAKGYTRDASGAAYKATDLAGRVSGHAVQLLKNGLRRRGGGRLPGDVVDASAIARAEPAAKVD